MKTKLITALRTAAKALEDGTFAYNWKKPESCNCGVIASTLMNKSISGLRSVLPESIPTEEGLDCSWRGFVQNYCPVTGLSENVVLKALQEAGMSQQDIVELETLSNALVCERAGIVMGKDRKWGVISAAKEVKTPKKNSIFQRLFYSAPKSEEVSEWLSAYGDKNYTIRYMRAWADLLTEHGQADQPKRKQSQSLAN